LKVKLKRPFYFLLILKWYREQSKKPHSGIEISVHGRAPPQTKFWWCHCTKYITPRHKKTSVLTNIIIINIIIMSWWLSGHKYEFCSHIRHVHSTVRIRIYFCGRFSAVHGHISYVTRTNSYISPLNTHNAHRWHLVRRLSQFLRSIIFNSPSLDWTASPATVLSRVYTSATCCAATSCADEQHVASNKQHVAGNKLLVACNKLLVARNKLPVSRQHN